MELIPIVSPVECPADYSNRKGWHCNLGHFIDVYIGWPGRVHDVRVVTPGQDSVRLEEDYGERDPACYVV